MKKLNPDLEKLIKQEEENISHDIFKYLPIRGLLSFVCTFNRIPIKREWKIEKYYQNEVYPVTINQVEYRDEYCDGDQINFEIYDEAFSKDVELKYFAVTDNDNDDDTCLLISYFISSRYSVNQNYLSSKYRHFYTFHLHMNNIEWEKSEEDEPIIQQKCSWSTFDDDYLTYFYKRKVSGCVDNFDDDAYTWVKHIEQNCIMTTSLILFTNNLIHEDERYIVHDIIGNV